MPPASARPVCLVLTRTRLDRSRADRVARALLCIAERRQRTRRTRRRLSDGRRPATRRSNVTARANRRSANMPFVAGDRLRTGARPRRDRVPGRHRDRGRRGLGSRSDLADARAPDCGHDGSRAARGGSRRSRPRYLPQDLQTYGSTFDRYGSWQYDQPYGYVWYPHGRGRLAAVLRTAPGRRSVRTAGRGSAPTRGRGRRITTAAGATRATRGSGFPGRTWGAAWVSWAFARRLRELVPARLRQPSGVRAVDRMRARGVGRLDGDAARASFGARGVLREPLRRRRRDSCRRTRSFDRASRRRPSADIIDAPTPASQVPSRRRRRRQTSAASRPSPPSGRRTGEHRSATSRSGSRRDVAATATIRRSAADSRDRSRIRRTRRRLGDRRPMRRGVAPRPTLAPTTRRPTRLPATGVRLPTSRRPAPRLRARRRTAPSTSRADGAAASATDGRRPRRRRAHRAQRAGAGTAPPAHDARRASAAARRSRAGEARPARRPAAAAVERLQGRSYG